MAFQWHQSVGHNIWAVISLDPVAIRYRKSCQGLGLSTVLIVNLGLGPFIFSFWYTMGWIDGAVGLHLYRFDFCYFILLFQEYCIDIFRKIWEIGFQVCDGFVKCRQFAECNLSGSLPPSTQHKCNRSFWLHGGESLLHLLCFGMPGFNKLLLSSGHLGTNTVNWNNKWRTRWNPLYSYEKPKIPFYYGCEVTLTCLK